jgi:hypothetical protein
MASVASPDLQEWKNDIEKEVMDIVKTRLLAKMRLLEENWRLFKTKLSCTCTDGFVNPSAPEDTPFANQSKLDESDPRNTGPNPHTQHYQAHDEQLSSHQVADDILAVMRTNTVDLQNMTFTIRLQLSLLAPPKRSADNLEASVQSEIANRLDNAIAFCQQFMSIIEQFCKSRGNFISRLRANADIPDTNQALYEYDEALAVSLTRGFLELQYVFIYLSDLLYVRTRFYQASSIDSALISVVI